MGCSPSRIKSHDNIASRSAIIKISGLIDSVEAWKEVWMALMDALEKTALSAAHHANETVDGGTGCFASAYQKLSIESTELFILSRTFLSSADYYTTELNSFLTHQRAIHRDVKNIDMLRVKLGMIMHKEHRISPIDEFEETVESRAIYIYDNLKIKIAALEHAVSERRSKLQLDLHDLVFEVFIKYLSEYGILWNQLSIVFQGMGRILGEIGITDDSAAIVSNQQNSKQKHVAESGLKLLSIWIKNAIKCSNDWDNLQRVEIEHCVNLEVLLTIFDNHQDSTFFKIYKQLACLHRKYSKDELDSSSLLQARVKYQNITNVLDEQKSLLIQIARREKVTSVFCKELDLLQSTKAAGRELVEKIVRVEAAKHRLDNSISDNRIFRETKMTEFGIKCWLTFAKCSEQFAEVYKSMISDLTIARQKVEALQNSNIPTISDTQDFDLPSFDSSPSINSRPNQSSLGNGLTNNVATRRRASTQSQMPQKSPKTNSVPSIYLSPSEDYAKDIVGISDMNFLDPVLSTTIKKSNSIKVLSTISTGRRKSVTYSD